jgi:ribonucleoside-diphosphate reductase subunit M2
LCSALSCADRLLQTLGYDKIWNVQNPFEWSVRASTHLHCVLIVCTVLINLLCSSVLLPDRMEMISLQGKTNFFEKKVTDYQKAGVMSGQDNVDNNAITFDDDF